MRDHDQGLMTAALQGTQDLQHLQAGRRVQVARWFIRQHYLWVIDEGTRNRHALLLSTGEPRGWMAQPVSQSYALQQLLRSLPQIKAQFPAIGQQRSHHVL